MKRATITIVSLIVLTSKVSRGFIRGAYPTITREPPTAGDDPGIPLILTPLIEEGKIEDAQMAAEVYFNGFLKKTSYAGFFTVDKTFNSNMFFWFFPSENDYANAPIVLWLQGGPGATSMVGLFAENGPFSVKIQHGLKEREFSWSKTHSMLYIDNPVGSGYSFTDEGGYAKNQTKVGEDLYNALLQFFTMFPDLQSREFYVSGESYAGKFATTIAYTVHQKNPEAKLKINLKGISIGNGFTDPINQLDYGDYLYQIGLFDGNTRDRAQELTRQVTQLIQTGDYLKAALLYDSIISGDNDTSLFKQATGYENLKNLLYPNDTNAFQISLMGKYVQRNDVRAAIHVGNATFNDGAAVKINLSADALQSVASWVAELLSHYEVLIYNGQLDIIVAYPLTENFLQKLNFNGADTYKTAQRYQWKVAYDIAGYVKQAGNLTEVLVRNAGHMAPADQPQWTFDMINRFTTNKPFH